MNAVRTCVGCRQRSDRSELLRVVIQAGELVFDPLASLSGRGAWVHPIAQCLEQASFSRALRVKTATGLRLSKEQAETMLAKNE